MPQLMPLNWFSTNNMVYMILACMCLMYSEIFKNNFLLDKKSNNLMKVTYWCW